MTSVGLIVRLQAKPGKEDDLAEFLRGAVPLVQAEPATTAWFAMQIDASTFAIVDAFPDQAGRQAHLEGAVAAALFGKADELLAAPPAVEQVDVLADVLPG
jgi:quinol monooxygenase YgiN